MRRLAGVQAVVLCLGCASVLNGQKPKAPSSVPKTIAVKEVLALLAKTEVGGQGCGGTTWNGKRWGMYVNFYNDPIKLPWDPEQQRVEAMFAYRGMPDEHHLIELSGPGFRYRRDKNVPVLTLVLPEEAK
jgi:hypothetical protein